MNLPAFTRRRAIVAAHMSVIFILCFHWLLASSNGIWPAAIDPRLHPGRTLLGAYVAMGMGLAVVAQLAALVPSMFKRLRAEEVAVLHFISTQCIALSCLLFLVTDAHDF